MGSLLIHTTYIGVRIELNIALLSGWRWYVNYLPFMFMVLRINKSTKMKNKFRRINSINRGRSKIGQSPKISVEFQMHNWSHFTTQTIRIVGCLCVFVYNSFSVLHVYMVNQSRIPSCIQLCCYLIEMNRAWTRWTWIQYFLNHHYIELQHPFRYGTHN